MSEKQTYECEECGGTLEIGADANEKPECCGRPMRQIPLDFCQTSDTAEHSRHDDFGDACDDGRSGKI